MSNQTYRLLVTGGAGFIGSNFVRKWVGDGHATADGALLVVLDALTYAGNLMNLAGLPPHTFQFVHGSILDRPLLKRIFLEYEIDAVVHFAAESHVDRSIGAPASFVETNVLGTQILLDSCRSVWRDRLAPAAGDTRFIHVSTDEVFGTLGTTGRFSEATRYDPRSPYSASKAGSDHLASAYFHTYGFPSILTHCSNNYGPFQFPEKLIPLMIRNCLRREPLPVYGAGENVRDWLYVSDHCDAVEAVLRKGRPGQSYNIGGGTEIRNIDLVRKICEEISAQVGDGFDYETLIQFVDDRPGHDFRYAMDFAKLTAELGWEPRVQLSEGLRRTIRWYLANSAWLESIESGDYRKFELPQARKKIRSA